MLSRRIGRSAGCSWQPAVHATLGGEPRRGGAHIHFQRVRPGATKARARFLRHRTGRKGLSYQPLAPIFCSAVSRLARALIHSKDSRLTLSRRRCVEGNESHAASTGETRVKGVKGPEMASTLLHKEGHAPPQVKRQTLGSRRFRERPAPTALVTATGTVRIHARSAQDGRRIAHSLRVRGLYTVPVPLTGGRELDVVLSRGLPCYCERTNGGKQSQSRPAGVQHTNVRTASGPVCLVFAPSESHRATALTHLGSGHPSPSRTFLQLVQADGQLAAPV